MAHGVSAVEIEAFFEGEPLIAPDPAHSAEEDRLIAIGQSKEGRPLFVALRCASMATVD
jgi:uncharacterized DUF497 family protein